MNSTYVHNTQFLSSTVSVWSVQFLTVILGYFPQLFSVKTLPSKGCIKLIIMIDPFYIKILYSSRDIL